MMPSLPYDTSGGKLPVDFIDKLDLDVIASGLLFWKQHGPKRIDEIIKKFNLLSTYYAAPPKNAENKFAKKTIITSRVVKGKFIEKEIDVIYQYSEEGNKKFEEYMNLMQTECSSIYDLLISSYDTLYKMKPKEEVEQDSMNPEMGVPGMGGINIDNGGGESFWGWLQNRGKKRTNFALDDKMSPYRRASNVFAEIQETPALLERVNGFHGHAMVAIDLGFTVQYQLSRKILEEGFMKTFVKPKLLKYINAAYTLKILEEQKQNMLVVTHHYEAKDQRREQAWAENLKEQQKSPGS